MSPSKSYLLHFTAPSRHIGDNYTPSFLSNSTIATNVGYQNKTVGYTDGDDKYYDGMFMMGSGFMSIGGTADSYSIQDLVPQFPDDADEDLEDTAAQIQEVGTGGEIGTVYMYLTATSTRPGFDGAGWYTREGSTYVKSTKTFTRGMGFLYAAPYAYKEVGDDEEQLATTLQSAGEVDTSAKTLTLELDGLWTLSFDRPVETSIQKLVPSFPEDAAEELEDTAAQIQEVSTGGEIGTIYMYLTAGSSRPGFDGAGWYTREGSTYVKSTRVFGPGEGFLYAAPYAYKEVGDDEEQLSTYLTFQE